MNKYIIILGGSGGVGENLVYNLEEKYDGDQVLCTYRANYCEAHNPIKLDVTDNLSINSFLYEVENTFFPKIRVKKDDTLIVINCIGANYNKMFHKADFDEWSKIIQTNFLGPTQVIHGLLKLMKSFELEGRVINFNSVVPKLGISGTSAYSASKSAWVGLFNTLSSEFATTGTSPITFNNINLGYSELGMIKDVPDAILDEIKKKIKVGRLCTSEEILNTVTYIIDTSYVNATELDLNGGIKWM